LISRLRVLPLLTLAVLGTAWGQDARAWWNGDWAFRKEISFDLTPTGADISGAPTDVPVLIRLSLGNFQYFSDTKADGSDIRFVAADDKTPLAYHIERFDPQSQIAFLWVRVPRLSGGAKTDKILLYYGNKNAPAAADAPGTYDANQALVYHFGGQKGTAQDATGYKSEPNSFTAEVNPASLIGAGVKFSGAQTISIPAARAVHLSPAKGSTLSAWVRFDALEPAQAYIAQLADQGRELVLGIAGDQGFARYVGTGAPVTLVQVNQLTVAEWHHIAVRIGAGQLTLFVDGVDAGHANVDVQEIGGTLTIGGSSANSNYYAGELDELEVSNIARSADWLKAAARSQGLAAPLVVYGGDTQKEGGGSESYFATTLRNVTVDGWVVIGILAVMFFASLLIMAAKAWYLNDVANGNTRFLAEFYKESADPAALEKRATASSANDEDVGASTLARLYQQGMRETLKRLEGQSAGAERAQVLSAQSIEAIRATLDAGLTRMLQQLNRQMVWLTVSIAGGPFLGLLGTVVGVMITFAAIAASGDVNINAIAPGIAAALVATVAGLGVAIPCLFGYNYLNTRVKEIGADMRVFVDEFVTRIAETYS